MSLTAIRIGALDSESAAYAAEVCARLRQLFGSALLAVYAIGSGALGGYDPASSDVDLVAVVERSPTAEEKAAVAAALDRDALPAPGAGLELVLYASGATPPRFELNLNTGPGVGERFDVGPGAVSAHWFVIDAAIAERHAVPLLGPPWRTLVRPVSGAAVRRALMQGLAWAARAEPTRRDTVRNALRALRYAWDGVWSSKVDTEAWARVGRLDDGLLVLEEPLPIERVRALLRRVRAELG